MSGDEILKNNKFEQGPAHWNFSHERKRSRIHFFNKLVSLSSSEFKGSVSLWQNIKLLKPYHTVKLQATLRCNHVIAGEKSWNKARLLLAQYQSGKGRWDIPHSVVSLTGTEKWKQYSKVFSPDSDIDNIKVLLQLNSCKGILYVKDLSLKPVQESAWYPWVQKIVFLSWGLFIVYIFYFYAKIKTKSIFKIILIIYFLIIFSGTLMPGKIKHRIIDSIGNQACRIFNLEGKYELKAHKILLISKAAHFLFFAIFTIILLLINLNAGFLLILLDIIMLAGATETMQCYITGRGPGIVDFSLDIAGGLTGLLLVANKKGTIKS